MAGARLKRLENQSVVNSLNLLAKGQGDEAVGFEGFSQDVAPHGQNGHGGQPAFAACPSEGQTFVNRTSNAVGNSLTRCRMMLTSCVLVEGDEVVRDEGFGHDIQE